MPKMINTANWGSIPMQGPRSYNYYLSNEELRGMKLPTNCEWLRPDPAITSQKSFYKRAYIHHLQGATYEADVLYSYNTPVAAIVYHYEHSDRPDHKLFLRLWGDWSATTAKHFQSFFGEKISKKAWEAQFVNSLYDLECFINSDPNNRKW